MILHLVVNCAYALLFVKHLTFHFHFYSYRLTSLPADGVTEEQILQVWAILRRLHAVGIVHRDVCAVHMMRDETG